MISNDLVLKNENSFFDMGKTQDIPSKNTGSNKTKFMDKLSKKIENTLVKNRENKPIISNKILGEVEEDLNLDASDDENLISIIMSLVNLLGIDIKNIEDLKIKGLSEIDISNLDLTANDLIELFGQEGNELRETLVSIFSEDLKLENDSNKEEAKLEKILKDINDLLNNAEIEDKDSLRENIQKDGEIRKTTSLNPEEKNNVKPLPDKSKDISSKLDGSKEVEVGNVILKKEGSEKPKLDKINKLEGEEDKLLNIDDAPDTKNLEEKKTDLDYSGFNIKENKFKEDGLKTFSIEQEPKTVEAEEKVIKQIVKNINFKLGEDKNDILLQLKPKTLGNLKMELEVKDGLLNAKILVDNHKTKEILENNIIYLQEELEENGMKIKSFEVFVGNNSDFEREEENSFNGFNKKNNKNKRNNKNLKIKETISSSGINDIYENNIQILNPNGGVNLFA